MDWIIKRAQGRGRWSAVSAGHRPMARLVGTMERGEPVVQEISLGMLGHASLDTHYPPQGTVDMGLDFAIRVLPAGSLDTLFEQLREINPSCHQGTTTICITLPASVVAVLDRVGGNRSAVIADAVRKIYG